MSTAEPPDWDDMFAQLEDEFLLNPPDTSQEEAYAEWLAYARLDELIKELARLNKELHDLGEVLVPKTPEGHALHSKHTALKMQLAKRG